MILPVLPLIHTQQNLAASAIMQSFFTDPYRFEPFNLTIFVSYLVVFGILSIYGLHRGWMVYTYLRWRRNVPGAASGRIAWPTVTVQLPLYNERFVVERLLDAVAHLDYPRELLKIHLLDDSTDDTRELARACVQQWQARGVPIHYTHRGHRTGFKAGNLAEGLKMATGELIAYFDSDFVPPPDFLRRLVPYFEDQGIAMVQARWTYLNGNYSVLTKVETMMQDGHFAIEQGARARSGAFFIFNGTAGVWRRSAIEDAGGWEQDTLTEDTDLSYRAQLRGWRFLYLPFVECPSELPVEMTAFKAQQARWNKGLIQTAKKLLPRIFTSDVPVRAKAEAFFHLTGAISSPLMLALSMLLLPTSIVRASHRQFQSIWIDMPGILSTIAIVAFYVVSQRSLSPRVWIRSMLYLPLLIALGIGISLSNTKAVFEGLFGIRSDFVGTPKYNLNDQSAMWSCRQSRNSSGWFPVLEIAFGLYYVLLFAYVLQTRNYLIAPFVFLFVSGFLYCGVMSLGQTWWRLRRGPRTQTAASPDVKPAVPAEAFPPQLLDSASAVESGSDSPGV